MVSIMTTCPCYVLESYNRLSIIYFSVCHFPDKESSTVIFHTFGTVWFPDLKPYDFWLWGSSKGLVYRDHVKSLDNLKVSTARRVRNIPKHILQLITEYVMLRCQMTADNYDFHIEQVMSSLTENSCSLYYTILGTNMLYTPYC